MSLKILIYFIIIVLVLVVISVYGYWQSVPPSVGQENSPKIEVEPESYDFGEINFTQIVNHIFIVKNIGNETLEIKRLATSCGCTTAEISQRTIQSGQSAELTVTYNPSSMGPAPENKGNQERIIYIKTNDPLNPQTNIIISAYVK